MGTFARENFSDQLNIDTPEGVALRFPVAGIGSRGVALLLDYLVQAALLALFVGAMVLWYFAVGSAAFGREMDRLDGLGKWFVALMILLFFVLHEGYWALFEAFWRGQTPGKRLMKLRVIKDTGRQITFFEAVARNLLRIVDSFPSFCLVGVVTMICNKRNQRLGDLAAGTIVIHEAHEEQPMLAAAHAGLSLQSALNPPSAFTPAAAWAPTAGVGAAGPGDPPSLFPADALAQLGSGDALVIDTFFARALDLPIPAREAMAQRIVATLCAKMAVAVPGGNPERALEALVTGMRGAARRF